MGCDIDCGITFQDYFSLKLDLLESTKFEYFKEISFRLSKIFSDPNDFWRRLENRMDRNSRVLGMSKKEYIDYLFDIQRPSLFIKEINTNYLEGEFVEDGEKGKRRIILIN